MRPASATGPGLRAYTWTEWYDAGPYLDLAGTISAYRIPDPGLRKLVLREEAALLGDGVDMTFTADLTLARRAD
ncbi:hypothetical protein GCM10022419_082190 [Nonomuraea rosea]|uniref:Uncharacterized protein n=1 Tax=Nonomuraea rosea TaxID=638574 RepID=A0ABP6YQG0_9ACTN